MNWAIVILISAAVTAMTYPNWWPGAMTAAVGVFLIAWNRSGGKV
jgi:hypothetical protein